MLADFNNHSYCCAEYLDCPPDRTRRYNQIIIRGLTRILSGAIITLNLKTRAIFYYIYTCIKLEGVLRPRKKN